MKRAVQLALNTLGAIVAIALVLPFLLLIRDAWLGLGGSMHGLGLDLHRLGAVGERREVPLLLRQAANGAATAVGVALACAWVAPPAGHVLAGRRTQLRRALLVALGIVVLAPVTLLLIPAEIVLSAVDLRDSTLGVVLVETGLTLPFAIWMMKTAFEEIPEELLEAAQFEGASPYRVYRAVGLPLVRGAQAAAFAVAFALSCGEYLVASTLLARADSLTLGASLVASARSGARSWQHLAPGLLFAALPCAGVLLLVQGRLARWVGLERWLQRENRL